MRPFSFTVSSSWRRYWFFKASSWRKKSEEVRKEVDQRRLADQHRVAAAFLFLSIDSNGAFISLFHGQRRLEIFLGLAALSVTVHKGGKIQRISSRSGIFLRPGQ